MNKRLLIFGDSIVWGAWDDKGGWVARLHEYTYQQAKKGNFENHNTVYNLGISGDTSIDLLNRFENELKSHLDEESDIVTIISIGTNDSQFTLKTNENEVAQSTYTSNLTKLINLSQEHAQQVIILGLLPVDDSLLYPMPWKPSHGYSNAHIQTYNAIAKKTAKKHSVTFLDLHAYFSNLKYKSLLIDGLHPNTKGHEILYNWTAEKLINLRVIK